MPDKKPYRVKVTVGDSVVEVEGEEKGVVAIVKALSEVLRGAKKAPVPLPTQPALEPLPRAGQIDIRTFFQEKRPSSDIEAAAVVAYYYKFLTPEEQREDGIDAQTLQEAFRLAGRPLPAKAIYTLVNARNAGYLDSTGESGLYRLNPVGFNLVEHTLGKVEPKKEKKSLRKARVPRKRTAAKTTKK